MYTIVGPINFGPTRLSALSAAGKSVVAVDLQYDG